MQDMSAWTQALGGLVIGMIAGFAVRHARLCSFGAIEDAMMGGDTRRLRVFGLALGIAMLGTQALIISGAFDPSLSTYTPTSLPIVAILIGSVLFGIGMALVGTCGFGSLVRLGAGDLRSLIVVLVLGAVAFATLRGIFAGFRIVFLERFAVAMPDGTLSDLASLASRLLSVDARAVIAMGLGTALCWLALGDPRLRRTPRLLSAGVALGLLVIGGWLLTLYVRDDFAGPPRPQSLTFVSTIGKSVFAGLLNLANLADFGVGSVFGVVAGSCLAAWRSAELQWEAFDDDREMRRHLTGAVLMGFGGILAGGCTIGQGLTAGSMLALSWPLALGGMVLGARIGIAILIEGSPRDIMRRSWTRLVHGRR
ncbi:MAG: protein of unknown function YeeE/YedE [Tardiphaga sp.]|nr:protein of unknown function YeeE/YedE [Tardiphaga sp.]